MCDIWFDVDTALSEVPINLLPLIDDSDFKSREESLTYDQAGLDLVWNFVTTAGAMTQTAVTPTESAGAYDWTNEGNGMYAIEIPASGGASINNDTEGFGWFTGYATGVLPWRGPVCGFRASGLNDKLIDSAYSATRGLAGTALPDAAADAAGGLPISDDGGLDMDAIKDDTAAILADTGTDGVKLADSAITTAKFAAGAIDAAAIANGAIDAATFAADVDAEVATYVWNAATASYGGAGTYGQAVEDVLEDTSTTLDTIVDSILEDTGTTIPGTISTMQGNVTDILTDTGTTLPGTLSTIEGKVDTVDTVVDGIASDVSGLATTADVADAVWDEATSGHTDAGSACKALTDTLEDTGTTIPTAISGLNDVSTSDVTTACTSSLNSYDPPTRSELTSDIGTVTSAITSAHSTTDGAISTVDGNVDLILADTGTDGVVISTATAQAIADALIGRNIEGGSSSGRLVKEVLQLLRNKVTVAGGTMSVYDVGDDDVSWTATVTTDAGASPITAIDPS